MTKLFSFSLSAIVALAAFAFVAPASADTFDVPPSARLSCKANSDGSFTVSWTGVNLATVHHFHGVKAAGWKTPIVLNGAKVAHFRGGNPRFNATNAVGLWMLWECSAQTPKGVLAKGDPRLDGLGIACDWIDPDDGQPKAALECVR